MDKVAFFLPTRKGSQRVKNKNTRPFAQIKGGLFENKISQLIQTKNIDEIILSTNDEDCILIAQKFLSQSEKIKIDIRPTKLCLDSTNLQDLIAYVPTLTNAEHILWGHVTTPMVDAHIYDQAVKLYLSNLELGYDSLVGVVGFRNFLLNNKGEIINNTTSLPWPRTQDLEKLYEINHSIFLAKRHIYEEQLNRIGKKPYLFEMNKISSFDIDWEEDFKIAEIIYNIFK
ncbi:acylneuraminate cytidylyltransferase family protein [Parabacteroides faecis]|uniref:N-acylneuraminate cytidylyltransferase n=1 Tax=Parabacteroides faecis TaxID=1217282 RepID=A0ABR6KI12_9BACT|nr:acylneuraminate cytidylyltransferase family protein [Parabacteroides faecis]MBB4621127.1 N-acylneuraminate cytidylyltransferase [Parabacteroides faecis]GGJ88988.1 hypothetical protein GCM10007084_10850 [Parabacteroides faecis]